MNKIKSFLKLYNEKRRFTTSDRKVFYELARKYLPSNSSAIIVDVGVGSGDSFVGYFNLDNKYENVYPLDANLKTIEKIKEKYRNSLVYLAPQKLPFKNRSVSLLHCSHMVEHLTLEELEKFLIEIDRVLMKDGILIISAPLLSNNFYSDRSHVRPYNPTIFFRFLCKNDSHSPTCGSISNGYVLENLVYRYRVKKNYEGYGSRYLVFELGIMGFKKILHILGIECYIRNGYTLVLKKH